MIYWFPCVFFVCGQIDLLLFNNCFSVDLLEPMTLISVTHQIMFRCNESTLVRIPTRSVKVKFHFFSILSRTSRCYWVRRTMAPHFFRSWTSQGWTFISRSTRSSSTWQQKSSPPLSTQGMPSRNWHRPLLLHLMMTERWFCHYLSFILLSLLLNISHWLMLQWMTKRVNRKSSQCETATSTTAPRLNWCALSPAWPCLDW